MTKPRFGKRLACATIMAAMLAAPAALAQKSAAAQDADPAPKPGKPINAGDVLSGELNAMLVRAGQTGKRVETYLITSQPRRLPPPNGLCNLETGPETFELVTTSSAQAAQLKAFVGREISVRIDEVACAEDAGEMSEAVVTKWRVVTKR
jgi:hypothetical protein